jgi:hypothetical protein
MKMKDLRQSADIASADFADYVVDACGCVWERQNNRWAYLASEGFVRWDDRDHLPEEYAPYLPLDSDAARIFTRLNRVR